MFFACVETECDRDGNNAKESQSGLVTGEWVWLAKKVRERGDGGGVGSCQQVKIDNLKIILMKNLSLNGSKQQMCRRYGRPSWRKVGCDKLISIVIKKKYCLSAIFLIPKNLLKFEKMHLCDCTHESQSFLLAFLCY